MKEERRGLKVAFLHPDLGIGGAERLVVDAGVALQSRSHQVQFFTSHHDKRHCFPETRDQLKVTVIGDWLMPRNIFGKCAAICAYLRMIVAALYLVLFSNFDPDVIICDQISACIPFLKLFSKSRVVFYCHFPDQLLTKRDSSLKSLYRKPIDYVEEVSTGKADKILVNSQFTSGIFRDTFKSLRKMKPEVLYPSLNTDQFDAYDGSKDTYPGRFTFLSINRYERKKNLGLAIKAFARLKKQLPEENLKLIMAGGYDPRVPENMQHFAELQKLASDSQLGEDVQFFMSPSDSKKLELLNRSNVLLYTPSGEHFGIVPIEAMYCGLPVVAVNDGGPTETVVDHVTGILCEPNEISFATAMKNLFDGGVALKNVMGEAGKKRVRENFSFQAFGDQLDKIVREN